MTDADDQGRIERAVEAGGKAFHDAMRDKRLLRWETSSEQYRVEIRDLVRPAVVAAIAVIDAEAATPPAADQLAGSSR